MVHYSAVSSAESKHKSGWASQRGAFYTDCQDTTLLATICKERRGGPALELTLRAAPRKYHPDLEIVKK